MVVKFRCSNCNYEFINKDKTKSEPPARCPYCSKVGTVGLRRHVLEEI
ncbi:hypothetical protein J4206_02925 [Candidatus Woesearchaeota archaeon]|nr:hypothetical protein [Candidatus Woesearchaeota archaeon]